MRVPLCVAEIDQSEVDAVTEVIRSGWYAHGKKNEEFEHAFAEYLGVKRAISLNSCTSALFLAVKGLGITGEVIVPSFTFVASANAIASAGATPVFADIRYDTCNVNMDAVEAAISPRTEAIMPVHYAGQPCEMDRLLQIADKHHLAIIEDAAETIGGRWNDKIAGSMGIGCFSFFPTKNITTGEGGMLTTNDTALADRVKALSGHGIEKTTLAREKEKKPWLRAATLVGYNFRLTNILAAMGVEQMKKLDDMNARRRRHSARLTEALSNVPGVEPPVELPGAHHVYQMYTLKVAGDRDGFVHKLREQGVEASVHFDPPVHRQPAYEEIARGADLEVTERVADSIVTLPMFPGLTDAQLDHIVASVRAAAEAA